MFLLQAAALGVHYVYVFIWVDTSYDDDNLSLSGISWWEKQNPNVITAYLSIKSNTL